MKQVRMAVFVILCIAFSSVCAAAPEAQKGAAFKAGLGFIMTRNVRDLNGDGNLDAGEISRMFVKANIRQLQTLDANGDGSVTVGDVRQSVIDEMKQSIAAGRTKFRTMIDRDNNGRYSQPECASYTAVRDLFGYFDGDKSADLDADESMMLEAYVLAVVVQKKAKLLHDYVGRTVEPRAKVWDQLMALLLDRNQDRQIVADEWRGFVEEVCGPATTRYLIANLELGTSVAGAAPVPPLPALNGGSSSASGSASGSGSHAVGNAAGRGGETGSPAIVAAATVSSAAVLKDGIIPVPPKMAQRPEVQDLAKTLIQDASQEDMLW